MCKCEFKLNSLNKIKYSLSVSICMKPVQQHGFDGFINNVARYMRRLTKIAKICQPKLESPRSITVKHV